MGNGEMAQAELELLRSIQDNIKVLTQNLQALTNRYDASEQNAAQSRSRMHQELDANSKALLTLDHRLTTAIGALEFRVSAAEKAMGDAAPKLRDWSNTQSKIEAAGWVGDKAYKFGIWMLACLGWIIAMREQISAWVKMVLTGR